MDAITPLREALAPRLLVSVRDVASKKATNLIYHLLSGVFEEEMVCVRQHDGPVVRKSLFPSRLIAS
jgi:hypothetical protein